MKPILIIAAVLLSTPAFAEKVKFQKLQPADPPCLYLLDENTGEPTGTASNPPCTSETKSGYIKIGDIKGEASVAEEAEESANEVKDQQRTKGETTLGDISVSKELDKSSTKAAEATDYNSSRSNRTTRGKDETHTQFPTTNRDAASGLPTGKRQHKPVRVLDADSDDDGLTEAVVCGVDEDCDDEVEEAVKKEKGKVDATWNVEKGEK